MAAAGGATAITGLVLFFVLGPDDDPEASEKDANVGVGDDGQLLPPDGSESTSSEAASVLRSLQLVPTAGGVQLFGRF